jgi:hypothetical protein
VRLGWTCPGAISDQMLPEVPMDANIMSLGIKHINLNKKMYADMPRTRSNKNPLEARYLIIKYYSYFCNDSFLTIRFLVLT